MKVYRVLAYLVAAVVAFQAATIAYALFALGAWVEKGGVLDKAAMEGGGAVPGESGFAGHFFGAMAIALVGLAFLVSSFFAKIPGGVKWAAITFGLIVLQWVLGLVSNQVPGLGALHGVNALAVLAVAMMAGMRAGRVTRDRQSVAAEAEPAPASVAG